VVGRGLSFKKLGTGSYSQNMTVRSPLIQKQFLETCQCPKIGQNHLRICKIDI